MRVAESSEAEEKERRKEEENEKPEARGLRRLDREAA